MRNRFVTKYSPLILILIFAMAISFSGDSKAQSIIKGKIWGGSDTLDLGKNISPDTSVAVTGDTVHVKISDPKIDWSSEDVIELPAKEISSEAKSLKLILSIPPTMKFIPDAPIALIAESSDSGIVTIGKSENVDPEKPFIFPITVNPGNADILLYYRVIACTTGPHGVCYSRGARLKVPVIVGDYDDREPEIRREIED